MLHPANNPIMKSGSRFHETMFKQTFSVITKWIINNLLYQEKPARRKWDSHASNVQVFHFLKIVWTFVALPLFSISSQRGSLGRWQLVLREYRRKSKDKYLNWRDTKTFGILFLCISVSRVDCFQEPKLFRNARKCARRRRGVDK